MSILDQIQNALMGMDQASFQVLCDAYLHKTLDVKEISSIGSVAGEAKTRVGQPDTLLKLANGKYVFVEATTQKSGLRKKMSNDLEECFDEGKTGVPLAEIDRIILACNRKLSQKDKSVLVKKGQEKDCIIEFLDLDTLSFDLYQKFPTLAKDFLNIELDTGQILSSEDFIKDYQKSKYATPLNNEFFFRENEKARILESLENFDLIILTGKAGVGKTRLALECAEQLTKIDPSFQTFCITNKNRDFYENLKAYFGDDGKYLIIVDDANRLFSPLSYILQLLKDQTEKKKIKIILTVRDYAINQIKNDAKKYSSVEVELGKLSDKEITKILEDGFEIRNHEYISRIYKISKGNARLAIMAAEVAKKEGTLSSINDVSDLYDIYFSSITDDLKELDGEGLIQIAGIISFFRALDRTNSEVFEIAARSFGLTVNELWTGLQSLHELEIVDIDYEVAKISDQILGTYLFYRAFFKDEALDFSILLNEPFDRFTYRLTDSVYPVLDTFNAEFVREKLRPHIVKKWSELKHDEDKALELIKVFFFINETEFLVYLRRQIDLVQREEIEESQLKFKPENYQPIKNRYLYVLRLFQSENISIVLDLIFNLLEKNLTFLPEVIHLLQEDFCFDHQSHRWNYYIQENVVSKLIRKSKDEDGNLYKKILLQVSSKYTQMVFRSNTSRGLTVTIHTVPLKPVEAMIKIRRNLWIRVIEIYEEGEFQQEVFNIIRTYNREWHRDSVVQEIVENDAAILLPFVTTLNSEDYQHCVLVNTFLDFLEKVGVEFEKSLRSKFTNLTYQISKVLLDDDRWELELGYEEYEKYKSDLIKDYFSNYKFEDYRALFAHCEEIQRYLEKLDYYPLHFAVSKVLINLSETNIPLFFEVLNDLFVSGNGIGLSGQFIAHKLVEKSSELINTYTSIKRPAYIHKSSWLFGFFQQLTKTTINEYFLNELYELLRQSDLKTIPQTFEYLENYKDIDKDVVINVINILYSRVKSGESNFSFRYLLSHGSISDRLGEIFADDLALLKEIYFYQCRIERYSDFKSKALRKIFELDNNFLFEYFAFLIAEKDSYDVLRNGSIDLSFVWEYDDYEGLFNSVLDYIYEKEEGNRYSWSPSFVELLFRDLNELNEKAASLMKKIFQREAKNSKKASYIFQLISNCFSERRSEFLEIFLAENRSLKDFKRLDFDTNHIIMADIGTQIPRLEGKIRFYESLLPLFLSVELLEHKLDIEERIQDLKRNIEDSRKKDFIGHY